MADWFLHFQRTSIWISLMAEAPLRRHKRCWFNPWVGKIPWRKAWQPAPVFISKEPHGEWTDGAKAKTTSSCGCDWWWKQGLMRKEQYSLRTWNVRSMNQGKLEMIKQEMARVNVGILGISKLKWTGMGEFNWDEYYIYYCGQESLKRNGVAIMVNKRVWNAVVGCNLKNDRMISVRFQGKPWPT